jgi:acyl-CoA hydrolase
MWIGGGLMVEERKVADSRVETVHMVRPNHLNAAGRLFGGILMQWLDDVAGLVAKRHSRSNIITASVDNLRFIQGAYQKDVIVIIGKVTYVGHTSMEIRVDTYVENIEGMRFPINRAYFTMVALDENDKPKKVPRLILESEEEKAEWEAAKKRRDMRIKRKEEGF